MQKHDDHDMQRTDDEIFRELLAVATDHEFLRAESPERFRSEVISDMTSLVRMAKQDSDIRQYFLETGRDPDQMLDLFLHRATAKLDNL